MGTLAFVILILVFGLIGYLAYRNIFMKKTDSDYPTRRGGGGRSDSEEDNKKKDKESDGNDDDEDVN